MKTWSEKNKQTDKVSKMISNDNNKNNENNEKAPGVEAGRQRRIFLLLFRIFLGIIFLAALLISCARIFLLPNSYLEIDFLDVGQGDASLLKFPGGEVVLIDGGPDNLLLHRLGEELPFYRRRLDYLVVSHFHDDHIIGLIEVLKRYRVRYLIFGADLEIGQMGEILLAKAARRGVEYIIIEGEGKIFFSAGKNKGSSKQVCLLWFLNPMMLGAKPDGNNSLLVRASCGGRRFLFSGDNEDKVETLLVSSGLDLRAEIFKASHHGSKTSNRPEFLRAINPEIIVIPVGKDNKFNHPSLETLSTAALFEIEVLRTDQIGTIRFRENLANIK